LRTLDNLKVILEIALVFLVVGALLYYKGDIAAAWNSAKRWLFAEQLPGPNQRPGSNLAGYDGQGNPTAGGVIGGGFGGGGGGAFGDDESTQPAGGNPLDSSDTSPGAF
jgi:hypothetical protein